MRYYKKNDYAPGNILRIYGNGFAVGECYLDGLGRKNTRFTSYEFDGTPPKKYELGDPLPSFPSDF